MSREIAARLAAGAAAAVLGLGTSLAFGVTAAAAATAHSVKYSCKIPVIGTQKVTAALTLSAPGKAKTGQIVKVSVQIKANGLPSVPVTNLTVKSTLTESGAQKGIIKVSTFVKKANSGSLKLTLSGRVKLAKSGSVHLTAGSSATFNLTSSLIGKATLACRTTSKLPVLGSISVAKAGHAAPAVAREH